MQALFEQTFTKSEYEVVVVDDGSQDDTQEVLKRLQRKSPVPIKVLHQPNHGQGVARNRGTENATGEIIILLGDDIIATPELLTEHDRVHRWHPEENAAVLGFITWHPKLQATPLMKFMEQGGALFGRFGGHQFAFDLLKGKSVADYRFFYTSNISLKRSLLLKHKFDPWFAGYGWEDIELGYRLMKKAGLALYYRPEAFAYHDHKMTDADFRKRMYEIGRSLHRLNQKYPELGRLPSRGKQAIFRIMSHSLSLKLLKPLWRDLYFYALSKKYFLEGVEEGYNEER